MINLQCIMLSEKCMWFVQCTVRVYLTALVDCTVVIQCTFPLCTGLFDLEKILIKGNDEYILCGCIYTQTYMYLYTSILCMYNIYIVVWVS